MFRREWIKGAGALALAAGAAGNLPRAWAAAAAPTGPYQWATVPFGAGGFVDGFVFHPKEAGLLYTRTDIGGAYRFDPSTQSWVPLLDHLSKADAELMGVLALAVDPADANRVYAACGTYTGEWARKAALLASNDRGASWTVTELAFKLGGNEGGRGSGERLQVDPFNGQVIYLGSTRDGLWRSDNRGASFRRVKFPGAHVSLVAVDPARGQAGSGAATVYAGCHDKPGLYVSRDSGESFERDTALPEMAPQRAAFGADGTLYVTLTAGSKPGEVSNPGNARSGGVWKRGADGRWTDITPVKPAETDSGNQGFGYSGLDADARVPGRLIVSTIERWSEGDEVFLSHDDGRSWTALGARSKHDATPYPWLVDYLRGQDKMGHWIADVKLDPHNPERAVYGTGYGLWMTGNLGAATKGAQVKWDFTVVNLEETATLEIKSPSGGATLLAAMGDVSGAAWDDLSKTPNAGLFRPSSDSNCSVDVAELSPAVMARVADGTASGGYVSTNGGVSWRPFGASPWIAKAAHGGRTPAGRIAVSAQGGFFVWAPEKQPALCSRDRGRSWQVCEGWPSDRNAVLAPVADRHVEGVFYVYDRLQGQVLASSDGGRSFKVAVTGLSKVEPWQSVQLLSAPGALRDLWLALPDGLVHLPAGDRPPKAIKGFSEAWLVSIGKGAPNAPYPSVYVYGKAFVNGTAVDGLFRSDDAGLSYQRIDDDRHRYGRVLSLAADGLDHGVLYIAAHGRGVLVGRPRGGA